MNLKTALLETDLTQLENKFTSSAMSLYSPILVGIEDNKLKAIDKPNRIYNHNDKYYAPTNTLKRHSAPHSQ